MPRTNSKTILSQVDLSQGDFTTLMSVLNENLQEGATKPQSAADVSVEKDSSADTLKAETTVSQGNVTSTLELFECVV